MALNKEPKQEDYHCAICDRNEPSALCTFCAQEINVRERVRSRTAQLEAENKALREELDSLRKELSSSHEAEKSSQSGCPTIGFNCTSGPGEGPCASCAFDFLDFRQ